MIVVVDTNVFVGACMGVGASARVVELCLLRKVQPVMGESLLGELEDVVRRHEVFEGRSRLSLSERESLLDVFLSVCEWRRTYFAWRPNLRDEGDNHIVELAVAANARSVVTWNVRDFQGMDLRFPSLTFCSPPDFIKEFS